MNPMTIQQRVEFALEHHRAGRLHEAEKAYRQILAEQPDCTDALNLLGSLAAQVGRFDAGIELIRKAIQLNPDIPVYHGNLGALFMKVKRWDDAAAALERAIQLNPDLADGYYNLGNALTELGKYDQAMLAFEKGLSLHPNWPEMHNSIASMLRKWEKFEEAILWCRKAIALRPDYADAHLSLALSLLLLGDFAAGWAEYEWRMKVPEMVRPRNFPGPQWTGDRLDGKTILLHAEQGLGDTFQFIRYVPLVVERGGRVVVECPPELAMVLGGVAGIQEIFVQGQMLPAFDAHCSIMSLAFTFKATPRTTPVKIPYISVPSDRIAAWGERVEKATPRGESGTQRVGLVWAGGQQHMEDRQRSMRLEDFGPLAAVKSVRFFMLQKGPPAKQADAPPPGLEMINWTADLHDFVETAALISNLDLVISVDTSVAHLAGALGKRVWLLLPTVPDFRWMLKRADSPWYPTMRIFRQKKAGDWGGVMMEIARALKGSE